MVVALLIVVGLAMSTWAGANVGTGDLTAGGDGNGDAVGDWYDADDLDAADDDTGDDFTVDDYDSGDDYGASDGYDTDGSATGGYDTDGYDNSGVDTYDTYDDAGSGEVVVLPQTASWAAGVEATLNAYFEGINSGDSERAWRQLSPDRQQQTTLDDFAEAVRTSYDSGFVVQEASYADGRAYVWLEFTSTQDPALGPDPGETCTEWSLDYVLVERADGTFLIDDVSGHGSAVGHTPC